MSYQYSTQGYEVTDAGKRIVVDPITRIEGHLRCEVNINSSGIITNAVSSGTLFRGLEIILKNRDPRDAWAFAERICGVCTGTHALTSIYAVENALQIEVPANANFIRNMMQLALWCHDHIVHFYQLAGLDWIDVVSAAKGDPKKASELAQSISSWPMSSPGYFADIKKRLVDIIGSGQLGIFKNGYWGHPAYKLPPEANLMLVAHYIEALNMQKEVVKIHTIFGGKNPHPNWIVGGMPLALNLDAKGGADVINMERLEYVQRIINICKDFTSKVLMPDSIALGKFYPEWLSIGKGISHLSILSYGGFPTISNDFSNDSLLVPNGAIINGNFNEIHPVDLFAEDEVREEVGHSWYRYPNDITSLHPFEGETIPEFSVGPNTKGTETDIKELDERARYSWIKTPRWKGHMMEVGPLPRVLIAYYMKREETVTAVDEICRQLNVPVTHMCSTLGRIIARSHEAVWAAEKLQYFFDRLIANTKAGDLAVANTTKWEPSTWPKEAKGAGFTEAPRGALGHWVVIKDTKIDRYQCVVPTTWNAAPRSDNEQLGPYEAALMDTHLAEPEKPLELLRTIHSFDPCLACATHIIGPDGNELLSVQCNTAGC